MLRGGDRPGPALTEQLVRNWGNEAWSANSCYLIAMLEWLPRTSGAIVECGSGLSTLVLAVAAALCGRVLYSFEHDEQWAERILQQLPSSARDYVQLNLTPLRSYGDFDWYSLENLPLPDSIGFVVCDGPPGSTRGGRYGLGAVLGSRMAPQCTLLLDDTQRDAERTVLSRWCAELGGSVIHRADSYAIVRLNGEDLGTSPGAASASARAS